MIDKFISFITNQDNILALQAMMLGIGGFVAFVFAKTVMLLKYPINALLKVCTVTLDVDNGDWYSYTTYTKIMEWVNSKNLLLSNHMRPKNSYKSEDIRGSAYSIPGVGTYYFIYKCRLFRISTTRHVKDLSIYYQTSITMFGRNKALVNGIVKEAMGLNTNHITVQAITEDGDWGLVSKTSKRTLDTIAINEDLRSKLDNNYALFDKSEEMYLKHGITWKNVVCLYGPPGQGKSSIIRALASTQGLDIHYVDTNTATDKQFTSAVGRLSKDALLIIEDIDSNKNFRPRELEIEQNDSIMGGEGEKNKDKDKNKASVSLNTLLNVLDGTLTPHGLKVILTTNHLELLDPAIIRAGRVDLCVEVTPVNMEAVKTFVKNVYDKNINLDEYAGRLVNGSQLSALIIQNFNDYNGFQKGFVELLNKEIK